jgi:hypothetical protein
METEQFTLNDWQVIEEISKEIKKFQIANKNTT